MENNVLNSKQAEVASAASQPVTLPKILCTKVGMTQLEIEAGVRVPVTILDYSGAIITQAKTFDKDGYTAYQVGLIEKKSQNATAAEKGHFKSVGAAGFRFVRELRLPEADVKNTSNILGACIEPKFKIGDLVDVSSDSKGKGFQGGMKRHNMSGGPKSHGASLSHRSLGSIGNRADPAKCFKNKKMPGQMGSARATIQRLTVVAIDSERKVLLVKGSVPGHKNCLVSVKQTVKP